MTGRNDKCHCRSGKKYKKCCMTNFTKGPAPIKTAPSQQQIPPVFKKMLKERSKLSRDGALSQIVPADSPTMYVGVTHGNKSRAGLCSGKRHCHTEDEAMRETTQAERARHQVRLENLKW